jgi:hypothetical protein
MRKLAPAKYIIYWCFSRYMSQVQMESLKQDFGESYYNQQHFLRTLKKYIDLELLRTHPVHPLDILVYNYLLYDYKGRLTRNKLLKRYEKEVMH